MNADAVSLMTTPAALMTPVKKSNQFQFEAPLSPNSQKLADDLERTAFEEVQNEMTNVFEWDDPISKDKKVTVIKTLPSGVLHTMCKIDVVSSEDSGVSQELVIKIPWNRRFIEKETIFWTPKNAGTQYYLHPEAVAYEKSLRKFVMNDDHTPDIVYKVKLPIPVQTSLSTRTCESRTFAPVKGGEVPKQNLIIIRLTGLKEKFAISSTSTTACYESD